MTSPAPSSSGRIREASCLPSSTPHWSKLLMFQIDPLDEDLVLVEGDERAQPVRGQLLVDQGAGGPVALEHLVRQEGVQGLATQPLRRRARLAPPRPSCRRRGPRSGPGSWRAASRDGRPGAAAPGGGQKVARDQPGPLVDQLEEGVLAVGAGLAPDDGAGRIVDPGPRPVDELAVALHVELLEVGREPVEVLVIGEDGMRLGP